MDNDGFGRWLDRCQQCFQFVDKLVQDGMTDRFKVWQRALEPISEQLAMAYVDAIVAGRVQRPINPSDWDMFASECRVWCHAQEQRQRPPAHRQPPRVEPDRRATFRDELRRCGMEKLAKKLDRERPLSGQETT